MTGSGPTRRTVVVWGAGGHALVVTDILRLGGEYQIAGFLDDLHPERQGEEFGGATILGGREQLEVLQRQGVAYLIFGFGNGVARLEMTDLVRAMDYQLASAVHPRAVVAADVPIGPGTVIAAGAVINPGSVIGENVIVNTAASVDHECLVEDGAHICPGVHLAGRVSVGRAAWVGIGTTVIERVRIGPGALIGAGSLVLQDVPAGCVAHGSPAKIIRPTNRHD